MAVQEWEVEFVPNLGQRTASNAVDVPSGAQRLAKNAMMRKLNAISKRDGSVPVTSTALAQATKTVSLVNTSATSSVLLVSSGTGLYKYNETNALNLVTMTNTLTSADVYAVPFTNSLSESIVVLTDGGAKTKVYKIASNTVVNIVPAVITNLGKLNVNTNTLTLSLVSVTDIKIGMTINVVRRDHTLVTEKRVVKSVDTGANTITFAITTAATIQTSASNSTSLVVDSLANVKIGDIVEIYDHTTGNFVVGPQTIVNTTLSGGVNTLTLDSSVTVSANNLVVIKGNGRISTTATDFVMPYTASVIEDPNILNNDTATTYLPTWKAMKYCWTHTAHVFVSDGSDTVWYSKRYEYDYFPTTYFERFVRENDVVNGAGVSFGAVCLIPMRRGWGVLTGTNATDFAGNYYLNTSNGCIAPRSIQKVTYPAGEQTVVYLSDDGVYEIYDLGYLDSSSAGTRQYSTRSLTNEKLDLLSFGFTASELASAVSYYDDETYLYLLAITGGSIVGSTKNYVLVMDSRNKEWYQWEMPFIVNGFVCKDNVLYFVASTGHLHRFSKVLYTDWLNAGMTTGNAVDFDVYSGFLRAEFTGDNSYVHYYVLEIEPSTLGVSSSLDVYLIIGDDFNSSVQKGDTVVSNQPFIWGNAKWGEALWGNLNFLGLVNSIARLVLHRRGKFWQRRWRNNRDEPVTILREKFLGTVSNRK